MNENGLPLQVVSRSAAYDENMICAICQDTFRDPVTALCGAHNFCKSCLTQHILACAGRYQQPMCPTCRYTPIQTSPAQLHVNVALRDAAIVAAAAPAPAPAPPAAATSGSVKQAPPPIAVTANRIAGTDKIHIALSVPETVADTTMPTVFITVVDISGSMGNSSVDTTQKTSDAAAFSRADLVRHAVATQIELLRPEDELALILFDNTATVALNRTLMTPSGRAAAKSCLPQIRPTGGTAIWAGLQKALAIAGTVADKNVVILLQTDGESDPSLNPPRGIPDTFRAWLDAHPATKLTLHTVGYGFGAALDMPLLRALASIGAGTANYIPDGSMVGTVFIHLMANLMSCQYRGVKVHLPAQGRCIPVGFLQAGQTRDFVLTLPDPTTEITVTADNTAEHASFMLTPATPTVTPAEVAWPLIHEQLVEELQKALTSAESGTPYDMGPIVAICRAAEADPSVKALLIDLADPDTYKGQLGKAFASTEAFRRWGRHYVPGVLCGHKNQWPINFKDEGSKIYGSSSTRRLIDRGDEIFTSLPPPTASCAAVATAYGGGAAYTPLASMASLHYSGGGCFLGASRVWMADGTEKRCDEIQPGDIDVAGYRIACVVKTPIQGTTEIVRISGPLRPAGAPPAEGGFTPWHPVLPGAQKHPMANTGTGWCFPASIAHSERVSTDAVYNFVLEYIEGDTGGHAPYSRPGMLIVDGYVACTLGHYMLGPVIRHPYFGRKEVGKRNIIEDLESLPGWHTGYITLNADPFVRDPATGIISGMSAE